MMARGAAEGRAVAAALREHWTNVCDPDIARRPWTKEEVRPCRLVPRTSPARDTPAGPGTAMLRKHPTPDLLGFFFMGCSENDWDG